jgi:hypothetical protein
MMNHSTITHTLCRGTRLFVIAVLLGALANVATPPVAHAKGLTVDTTVDNATLTACTIAINDCSLRGAITRANNSANADTITFAAATNGTPIVLAGAA